MRKVNTAEWILSFVMTADHAAATAGDLMELSSAQGSYWFWMSVLRVFAGLLLRNAAQRPVRVIGVAVSGFVMQFLVPLPFVIFFGSIGFIRHPVLRMACVLCIFTLTQYAIGRSIAVLSRGNPAAVCVAIGLLNGILGALNVNNGSINMAIWQAPVILGVIMAQRHLRLVGHA